MIERSSGNIDLSTICPRVRSYVEELQSEKFNLTEKLKKSDERVRQLEDQKESSYCDELTGVRNYRYLLNKEFPKLEKHIKNFNNSKNLRKRNNQAIFFGFADLDGLKNINDTLGHSAGDHIIKTVAESLLSGVRPEDTVGRYTTGDEFYLIIRINDEIMVEPSELSKVLNERCGQMAHNASGGLAKFSMAFVRVGDYKNMETVIDEADALMYDIKKQKKTKRS